MQGRGRRRWKESEPHLHEAILRRVILRKACDVNILIASVDHIFIPNSGNLSFAASLAFWCSARKI